MSTKIQGHNGVCCDSHKKVARGIKDGSTRRKADPEGRACDQVQVLLARAIMTGHITPLLSPAVLAMTAVCVQYPVPMRPALLRNSVIHLCTSQPIVSLDAG
jgi:hypothetical protein